MAGLSHRLEAVERVLEAQYGPVIVEGEPKPKTIDWSPEERFILRQHDRDRATQLRNMLESAPEHPTWRAELALLKAAAADRCNGCEAWPMGSIRFDHDGSVRCGECQMLHEWLPPKTCDYFGHPAACVCSYDPVGELQWRWFWPLITDETQRLLLEWYGR